MIEYWNHPRMFVQPHIGLFEQEREHYHRYKESIRPFHALNRRWVEADSIYSNWIKHYEYEEAARARQERNTEPQGRE